MLSSTFTEEVPAEKLLSEAKSGLLDIWKKILPSCSDYKNPHTFDQNKRAGDSYHLSEQEYKNLVIVLSILIQIVDRLKGDLSNRIDTLYLYVKYGTNNIPVPIHFEPFSQLFTIKNEKKEEIIKIIEAGDERACAILNTLVFPFIISYKNVFSSKFPEYRKKFCQLLGSHTDEEKGEPDPRHCINGRTRPAFAYAMGDFRILPFTEILSEVYEKNKPEYHDKLFFLLRTLLVEYWGEKFKPDSADAGISKEFGKINVESYLLIRKGLNAITECRPTNHFLNVLIHLPSHLKSEFIKILVKYEKEFMLKFSPEDAHEEISLNQLIKFQKINDKTFFNYLVMDCKAADIARKFISKAVPSTLNTMDDIWNEPLYSKTIGAFDDKALIKIMRICRGKKINENPKLKDFNKETKGFSENELICFLEYTRLYPLKIIDLSEQLNERLSREQLFSLMIDNVKAIKDFFVDISHEKIEKFITYISELKLDNNTLIRLFNKIMQTPFPDFLDKNRNLFGFCFTKVSLYKQKEWCKLIPDVISIEVLKNMGVGLINDPYLHIIMKYSKLSRLDKINIFKSNNIFSIANIGKDYFSQLSYVGNKVDLLKEYLDEETIYGFIRASENIKSSMMLSCLIENFTAKFLLKKLCQKEIFLYDIFNHKKEFFDRLSEVKSIDAASQKIVNETKREIDKIIQKKSGTSVNRDSKKMYSLSHSRDVIFSEKKEESPIEKAAYRFMCSWDLKKYFRQVSLQKDLCQWIEIEGGLCIKNYSDFQKLVGFLKAINYSPLDTANYELEFKKSYQKYLAPGAPKTPCHRIS
jgi:hypothetical protein